MTSLSLYGTLIKDTKFFVRHLIMKRLAYSQLEAWKSSKTRKPLIINGARQVGKTYILKEFANQAFKNAHYFNFEKDPKLNDAFKESLNPKDILRLLSLISKKQFNIEKDLIIFDEIQACPQALTSLKYFNEDMPNLPVCSAGSLLGVHLGEASFPVGKVTQMNMYPMNFEEFLIALGEEGLANAIKNIGELAFPEALHSKALDLLKQYFITGGLPEVVSLYKDEREHQSRAFERVRELQSELYNNYIADMAKHCGKVNAMHVERIFRSIPSQLGRNGDDTSAKFRFKDVITNGRYDRLAGPISWLEAAGLVYKVPIVSNTNSPLSAQTKDSSFKLQMFDVGLLGSIADLSPHRIMLSDYGTFKGYFVENYILQSLMSIGIKPLYCWQEGKSEVEFLYEHHGEVIPIEVKSGKNLRAKSLGVFMQKYSPKTRVKYSSLPYKMSHDGSLYSLPLYSSCFAHDSRVFV